jgi:hypothetical protein
MKVIPFNKKYSITEDGCVFNNKTKRQKKGDIDKYGYHRMCLDDERKKFYVHRLVAITYIENPEEKATVNHKDGNKLNNHISNLEWLSFEENINHAMNNNIIKRTPLICTETKKVWTSLSKASKDKNINPGHLYNMLHGKTKNTTTLKYQDL